jgi:uncharacterized protein involved in tellurium resistance
MELKKKGASAALGSFKQLKVSLIWTSAVDLDLMAFYKTKDGRTGGVYSDNYSGGNMGDLNAFPFMQLSGDAGVGATGGDNREDMLIANIDQLAELYVVAVNFTDASSGENKVFKQFDARVEVMTDKGETHTISLDSGSPGSVAVLCKFTQSFMGAQLANDSSVMGFDAFKANVPGASDLKLLSKITLKKKGDSTTLKIKKKGGAASDGIVINLNWKTSADLDLGCFYELREGGGGGGGFLGGLLGGGSNVKTKSVIDGLQFANNGGPRNRVTRQGCFTQKPWVWHQGDDRTGSASQSGEFLHINPQGYGDLKRVHVYAFIYEGAARWDQTDGVVEIKVPGNPDVIVQMGKQTSRQMFCVVATIDFVGSDEIRVTKQVSFHDGHADADRGYAWGMRWQAGRK